MAKKELAKFATPVNAASDATKAKTARLRALRLAKEAETAEKEAAEKVAAAKEKEIAARAKSGVRRRARPSPPTAAAPPT